MAKQLEYNATLEERIDVTGELTIFKTRLDEPIAKPFEPGQYVTLGMNNEQEPVLGSVRRPMSIASAPEEGDVLEFYIRYVNHPESNNPLTHLLWPLTPGDRLYVRAKAVGHFTIAHTIGENDSRAKILVAAGTGLAPFVSMVRSEVLRQSDVTLTDHVILHGVSYPPDLGYRSELELYQEHHHLHYLNSISRAGEVPDWIGDNGRVEDYFLPERIPQLEDKLATPLNASTCVVYICGLQGTISETVRRLLGRGFIPDNRKLRKALAVDESLPASLFYEQYDATPVIDIKDESLMSTLQRELQRGLSSLQQ